MALQKQTVSLNLGNGMDQKTDDKVGPDNKFSILKNFIYSKLFKLYKRFGTDKLTTFTGPVGFTTPQLRTSNLPSSLTTYGDQLVLQNDGYLYSLNESDDQWTYKGHYHPVDLKTTVLVSDENNYSKINEYLIFGKKFVFFTNGTTTFYSCVDDNGNYLVKKGTAITSGTNYSVAIFTSVAYLVYVDSATSRLKRKRINTDGNLTSEQTLEFTVGNYAIGGVLANITNAGERFVVTLYNTGLSKYEILTMDATGFVDFNFIIYYGANANNINITYFDPTNQVFMVHYIESSVSKVDVFDVAYSGTGVFSKLSTIALTLPLTYGAFVKNPINNQIYLFGNDSSNAVFNDLYWSGINQDLGGYVVGSNVSFWRGTIYYAVFSPYGLVTGLTKWLEGYDLIAKPYMDTARNTFYVFVKNFSQSQSSCYALDFMLYTQDQDFCVLAKWNDSTASDDREVTNTSYSSGKIIFATNKVTDLLGNPNQATKYQGYSTLKEANTELFKKKSVYEISIDLEPDNSASTVNLSKAIHGSGGVVRYYDGSDSFESSFYINPEFLDIGVVYNANDARYNITRNILRTHTAGATQGFADVYFKPGYANLAGPTYYWTYYSSSHTISISYKIDGSGTAGGPGTQILVNINSTDTAFAVAYKTYLALLPFAGTFNITLNLLTAYSTAADYGPFLSIVNTVLSAVSVASNANYKLLPTLKYKSTSPYFTVGDIFTYCFVWKYYDIHGQLIYSAPSNPQQIKLEQRDPSGATNCTAWIYLNGYIPNLTDKDIDKVIVEIYRTTANGTIFYKLTNETISSPDVTQSVPKWLSKSVYAFNYIDCVPDSFLIKSPEFIYTNGGVLPNYQLPNANILTTFKNRIVGVTEENPTAFYYSKSAINGSPVEFAAENFVQVDVDLSPITGLSQLDDKLIVFKKRQIYFLAGDGSNDLGANSSFSNPTTIASDVGCVNQNSIVLMPLGLLFKSEKGIYLLDRALQVSYIGKEVEDYNQYDVAKAQLVEKQNQIRFTLKNVNVALVYDYLFNRWTIFEPYGGDSSAIWKSSFARVDSSGYVYLENQTKYIDDGSVVETYNPTFTTKWLQIKNIQDYQRVYRVIFLGDLKSAHTLNIKVYYDYDETNFDEYNFDSANISGTEYDDSVYQPMIHLKRQKSDALRFIVTIVADGGTEQCLELVDMSLQVGVKQGLMKVKADKRL